ncbi:G5 domain-containing protein [Clostridium sp. 'deep sea']|uniref:G5 and 3D domain-containing protein n=1 Tax=Clostridium sp. 'deep sea' TaxID=2779445 RepID=UPI001896789A|nr:3D domain-containing protein [Clostridium sp. 'deep sea']QOR34079.1 G5 domain-containing protein [Clostridium sp. 'deep sea']
MRFYKVLFLLLFIIIIIFIGLKQNINSPIMASSINNLLSTMQPRSIVINDGDKVSNILTTALTVGDLLREQQISLNDEDIILPSIKQSLNTVKSITILRITKHTYIEKINTPYQEKRIPDDSLYIGEKKEVVGGEEGIIERKVMVTKLNNKPIKEQVFFVTEIKKPINRVINFGTDTTITINNKEYKVLNCLNVKATAYTKYYECTGKTPSHPDFGITASGLPVKIGHIAVDPKIIAMHSKVYIEGQDKVGNQYTGIYTATDTGGAIKGNRIDVYMEDTDEMYIFGVRQMRAFVIEEK